MRLKALLSAALVVTAAACTPANPDTTADPGPAPQAAPAGVNPVGRYEFNTLVQGQALTAQLEITGTPGAYTGRMTTNMTDPITISGVTVNGQQMTLTGDLPEGPLTIRMTFTDATNFTGAWTLGTDGGNLTGRRTS